MLNSSFVDTWAYLQETSECFLEIVTVALKCTFAESVIGE